MPFNSGYAVFNGLKRVIDFIEHFGFSESDLEYLKSIGYKDDFLSYLKDLKFHRQHPFDARRRIMLW